MAKPPEKRPETAPSSGTLDALSDKARAYARAGTALNTRKAYAADWAHFDAWCRAKGQATHPPAPALIGLYLSDLAATHSTATIERRLSGLAWAYAQAGTPLDRKDRHIAAPLAGIRRSHARPPRQKDALAPDELLAMVATLPQDLRGLRDRALLLLGYAGALRRSEITRLDLGRDDTPEGRGWVDILDEGALLTLNAKTGWREVAVGRGSHKQSCPVEALTTWIAFARLTEGPLFRRCTATKALPQRLSDRHVARLIKASAEAAALRPDLTPPERTALFSGHSLRAGLATHAQASEAATQAHLGHASPQMTRRYQRHKDRFRLNLTKAVGL